MILPIAAMTLCFACSPDQQSRLSPKPNAIGKAGQLLVVAEGDVWHSIAGDAFREHLLEEFPVLPRPEPRFDVKHVEGIKFNSLRKEWRVIVFLADLSQYNKVTKEVGAAIGERGLERAKMEFDYNTVFREDVWADGQLLIYLFAPNKAQLLENIQNRSKSIIRKIEEADFQKIKANTYQSGVNRIASQEIKDKFSVSLDIPGSYRLAVFDSLNNELWLRRETGTISSNILLKTMKYTEKTLLTEKSIIAMRDSVGRRMITSAAESSYMISNTEDLPVEYQKTEINGHYTLEARGVWEMKNDFMGGPFLSYMIYNPNNQKVVYMDGFVHAPGEDKRSLMQQLELIMRSMKF